MLTTIVNKSEESLIELSDQEHSIGEESESPKAKTEKLQSTLSRTNNQFWRAHTLYLETWH